MVLARGGVGKERDCNKWYKFSFTCEIYYLADFDQKMAWSNDILNPFNSPSFPPDKSDRIFLTKIPMPWKATVSALRQALETCIR